MGSPTKNLGMKGKKSTPITSWSREAQLERTASGLWGASKFSHEPEVFVINMLRPIAGVMAVDFAGRSKERQLLYTYADTNFRVDDEALKIARQARLKLRKLTLNTDYLERLSLRPQAPQSFSAHAILTLLDQGCDYIEPNAVLQSSSYQLERGDKEVIIDSIKHIAHLAFGDAVFLVDSPSHNSQSKNVA